jgi:hypothetical protein
MSPANSRPLRIGLLLDGFAQPAWVSSVLDEITRSGIAEVALVIPNASTEKEPCKRPKKVNVLTRGAIWYRNRRHLPFAAYEKFDA